ncbi:hypothetical protein AX15_001549 [Amanita polypyramis BW_CC]|nr:hypothetical protein AX15_001549 [Amanita polypyramis BW_CC]
MHDTPYTTADEDPFNVTPLLQLPRRRRSSLLDKWIRDQHTLPSVPPDAATSAVETYLGYPCLTQANDDDDDDDDDDTFVHTYDLVQDQDIPQTADTGYPVTPTRTPSHRASSLLHRAASFRNFNLHIRSNSQPATPARDSPRPSSRLSFLAKSSRSGVNISQTSGRSTPVPQHNRSSSLATVHGFGNHASPRSSIATVSSRWRPGVLDHFSTPSTSSQVSTPSPQNDSTYTPPRPSVSSADTFTTTTGASDNDIGLIFSKLSLVDSIRSRGDISKTQNPSSTSLWSQSQTTQTSVPSPSDSPRSGPSYSPCSSQRPRTSATFRPYAPPAFDEELDEVDEEDGPPPPSAQKTSTRPQIAYSSGGSFARVHFSSLTKRHKKKRRLIVSGIRPNDALKFDSLKRWCENFGEVSQITRMPNNDLHVHFRKADVAETVCRLRAKVYINGVGSVQLSWAYGDKL